MTRSAKAAKAAKAAAAKAAAQARRVVAMIRRALTVAVLIVFAIWLVSVSAVVMWSSRDEARPAQVLAIDTDTHAITGMHGGGGRDMPVVRLEPARRDWEPDSFPYLLRCRKELRSEARSAR